MYWHTTYFVRLRVTEITDHSLHMNGNVTSYITRGILSSGDEYGIPYAQDSPLTKSWLLSKQQKFFVEFLQSTNLSLTSQLMVSVEQDCPEMLWTYLHHIKTYRVNPHQSMETIHLLGLGPVRYLNTWLVQWRHPSDPETYPCNWLSY
jgi:hypothetical protein